MTRARFAIAAAVLLAAGGAIWALWPEAPTAPRADSGSARPAFAPPAAPRSVWDLLGDRQATLGTSDAGEQNIHGTVVDPEGKPVPGAEIEVFEVDAQASVLTANCPVCGEPLLHCESPRTGVEVLRAVRANRGVPVPIAATRAGPTGEFALPVRAAGGLVVKAHDDHGRRGLADQSDFEGDDPWVLTVFPGFKLAGQVMDPEEKPVPRARVALVGVHDAELLEVVADAQGLFSVQCPSEPCELWAYAEADGYAPSSQLTGVYGPEDNALILTLSAARTLEVTTLLAGQPIDADVSVDLDGHPEHQRAVGGKATFTGLTGFDVTVDATSGTYASGRQVIALEQSRTRHVIDLRAAAWVSVEVRDDQSRPVAEATVMIEGAGSAVHTLATDDAGFARLGPVGEGAFHLSVEGPQGLNREKDLDVVPGDNPVSVTLPRPLLLRGHLVDFDGRPAVFDTITALSGNESYRAATDRVTGAFEVAVSGPGPWTLTNHQNARGVATAVSSAPADGIVLKLDRRAGLRVLVTADGRPAPSLGVVARVRSTEKPGARDDRPQKLAYGSTDEGGIAELWGLSPGTAEVEVVSQVFRRTRVLATLENNRLTEVTIAVDRGAQIDGRVVDASGKPAEGADIIATVGPTRRGEQRSVRSDEQGAFTLVALDGALTYELTAALEDAVSAPQRVKAGATGVRLSLAPLPRVSGQVVDAADGRPLKNFLVDGIDVESEDGRFSVARRQGEPNDTILVYAAGYLTTDVELKGRTDVGTIALRAAPHVTGRVVNVQGVPVPGAQVECSDCEASATTGADGRFEVVVTGEELPLTLSATRGTLSGVADYAGHSPIEIRLTGPVRVEGALNDLEGRPMAGAVNAVPTADGPRVAASADAAGRFEMKLPPGEYMFMSSPRGFLTRARVSGESTKVVVGGIAGRCNLGVAWPDVEPFLTLRAAPGTPTVAIEGGPDDRTAYGLGLECGRYTLQYRYRNEPVGELAVDLKPGATSLAVPAPAGQPDPDDEL